MAMRRACVLLIAVLTAAVLATLLWHVLAPGGWTPAKLVMIAAFAGTAPWTGLCMANGLIGFLILVGSRDPVRAVFPGVADDRAPLPRVAVAVTVRDEEMRDVLRPLRRLLRALDGAGAGDAFAVFILSDTRDARAARSEKQAVARFRAEDRDPRRIRYRRRATTGGFKAGNIMEFLDRHADGFELMLTLDADSDMSAAAVLRLVRAIQADPTLAIAQHLTVGLPASSAFPRLFQFGMRSGMRIWATGQAWWQGDEGPYWGHNAVVRIAPFRTHCRLPLLPGGRHILSHDQVEAAILRGAGWGVRVLPDEDGSWEANPAGAAGIPPPRPALAGRQPAVLAPAAAARAAADGAMAAGSGDAVVRRHAVLPAVPARRRRGRGNRRHVAVSGRAGPCADPGMARRALRAEAAGLCRGGPVAAPAAAVWRPDAPRRGRGRGIRLHVAAGCHLRGGEGRRRWRARCSACAPGGRRRTAATAA